MKKVMTIRFNRFTREGYDALTLVLMELITNEEAPKGMIGWSIARGGRVVIELTDSKDRALVTAALANLNMSYHIQPASVLLIL